MMLTKQGNGKPFPAIPLIINIAQKRSWKQVN